MSRSVDVSKPISVSSGKVALMEAKINYHLWADNHSGLVDPKDKARAELAIERELSKNHGINQNT